MPETVQQTKTRFLTEKGGRVTHEAENGTVTVEAHDGKTATIDIFGKVQWAAGHAPIQHTLALPCISLWQPWASLVGRGKGIETRHWPTKPRALLGIHAAKTRKMMDMCDEEPFHSCLFTGANALEDLPFGAVVAVCKLAACVKTETLTDISATERAFGDYTPGRYGWILEDIELLRTPFVVRGGQGFFNVDLPMATLLGKITWNQEQQHV
jgi:hypothetical protein